MAEARTCALPHAALTEKIIGCFYEVARDLGYGYAEKVGVRALQITLSEAGLEALTHVQLTVPYKGRMIGDFHADLVVNRTILLEVKATAHMEDYAQAQILNYLKCAGGGVGLLLNFGKRAEFKRFVLGDPKNSLPLLRPRIDAARGPQIRPVAL
jgi:GxxExxY protein